MKSDRCVERIIDCDECVGVLEKQIDEIEKSSENEDTILEKIIYYNGLKRDCWNTATHLYY